MEPSTTFCLIPYCHPDFSWTHFREWHEERYAVVIADALDLMAAHPEFRFCVEPWMDEIVPFLERCPDRTEELRERLNSGQMGVLAFTLTSPRPVYASEETFLRNMILGRETYLSFAPQADLTTMSCPDVGIGHSQMPQIVKLAGARLYRGWRSQAALDAKGVPPAFRWRGLDGTEILTSRGCYGGLISAEPFTSGVGENWEAVVEALRTDSFADGFRAKKRGVRWIAQGMDDARPLRAWPGDEPLLFFELVEEWNQREPSRMIFATPGEYARLLEQEVLPVWEGVIDPVDVAYNAGWGGSQGLWRLRQQLEVAMLIAERAAALARSRGGAAASPEDFRRLWWETVRLHSHAQSWAYQRDWDQLVLGGRWTLRQAEEITRDAVSDLSGAGRDSAACRPLVLFNPLPYEREELVEVYWPAPRQDMEGYSVVDESGAPVEFQVGEALGDSSSWNLPESTLIFRAHVPALGVALYHLDDGPNPSVPEPPAGDLLDNGALRLQLSPRGLQELTDPAIGLTWTAPEGSAIGDVRLFEMAPGILGVGPITAELGGSEGVGQWILTGPLRWVYRWETVLHGHRVTQDLITDCGARYVDFLTRIHSVEARAFWAFCLELPFVGPLQADIPFGVEPRHLADEPWAADLCGSHDNIERTRRNQFWARSWASISDGQRGLSLITVDGDRYWTWDENTRQLRHLLYLMTPESRESWESLINKERLGQGWHDFRHRLVMHEGDWREARLWAESDRLRLPLQAVKPLGPAQERLVSGNQLRLKPDTVRLSAFYEAPSGWVLRVHESSGSSTQALVELPFEVIAVTKTDLALQPLDATQPVAEGRVVKIPLRAWEIATILMT